MNALGNDKALILSDSDEVTIGTLLDALSRRPADRLTFRYGGRPIRKGYHVTEVKAGSFAALDCGANPEAWTEIFVQLWDADDAPEQMTAKKFAAIIGKVADHVALDRGAKLTFEVSDGVAPMQLHRAASPALNEGEIVIELSPRPASCKPRDRWLESEGRSCCGASDQPQPCCGQGSAGD
ncbi:DUF6428 family protein [Kumtagia ephedrae]|uniref:Uncharacterized protein n=1 Tax=Kumtagia ephedrae TaxID=2116701 RepID=A0A2P7SGR8_9HYPH|nr:DUF6428 family protein [Mesorhizobium ephedrae]PSJ61696.1 hypothetical protein C7I84_08805 [Mesorhizobium ephedrae]